MIHKVESLVSIGKFRNYQASGDVAFKKLTLIYADNGSGKTTISSVLRSLSENRPDRILKRKSTSSTAAQSARIIQRPAGLSDIMHLFNPTGWRHVYPDIEIFDIHFVDENIYSGVNFTTITANSFTNSLSVLKVLRSSNNSIRIKQIKPIQKRFRPL